MSHPALERSLRSLLRRCAVNRSEGPYPPELLVDSGEGLVPVPPTVYADMLIVLDNSPWKEPDHFLFYSADPKRPVSHKKIDVDFARALQAVGIHEGERKRRNLSFHSWRHWSNSFLVNKGLPPLRAQQIIGHTSLKMTANYLHPGQDFSDVLKITGELFGEKL